MCIFSWVLLLSVHVLEVLDGVEAELSEGVEVQNLFILDLLESLLDLIAPLLEDAAQNEVHSVILQSKISSKFKFRHFLYLKSANDSHDLEESLLASLDRLLYAQLSAPYSALKANLYLLQELTKEITIV